MAARHAWSNGPASAGGARRFAVMTCVLTGMMLPSVAAQDAAPDTHVRALDESARRLIVEARSASPTVARLIATLDHSDVIVLTSVTFMSGGVAADTRFVSVTRCMRILSLRIDRLAAPWDQITYLGHELQHALEVASAPRVRSDSDLRALMTRIGRNRGSGRQFETDRAIQVALNVRHEIGAPPVK